MFRKYLNFHGKCLQICLDQENISLTNKFQTLYTVLMIFKVSRLLSKITAILIKKKNNWKYSLLRAIKSVKIKQWREKIIFSTIKLTIYLIKDWNLCRKRKKLKRKHKLNYWCQNWSWQSKEWERVEWLSKYQLNMIIFLPKWQYNEWRINRVDLILSK